MIGLDLAGKFQITNGKMTNYRPEASDTKNSVQIFQISSIMLSNSIDDALLDKKLGSTDGAGYIAEQFLSTHRFKSISKYVGLSHLHRFAQ